MEWQHEANFFTLRVRGKQWYWVYKFDFKSLIEGFYSQKLYKLLGKTSFCSTAHHLSKDSFYSLYNSYLKNKYLLTYNEKLPESFFNNNLYPTIDDFNEIFDELIKNNDPQTKYLLGIIADGMCIYPGLELSNDFLNWIRDNLGDIPQLNEPLELPSGIKLEDLDLTKIGINNVNLNTIVNGGNTTNLMFSEFSVNRFSRDIIFSSNSVDLLKSRNYDFFPDQLNNLNLIKLRYDFNTLKPFNNNLYLVLKQKPLSDWSKFDTTTNFSTVGNYGDFVQSYSDSFIFNDTEKIQYYNNMRLLRLNKMLFLPSNLQLSVVTNSFDVIHSWFIPGLGLKMDCVPGRSTHHTLYIDLPGIYYGQCAEICGRFHHHMPIRVCALDLEHYLLWFNHYVLPSIVDLDLDKVNAKSQDSFKYLF